MSEKTEDPTPKRLRKAREDGDSGASAFAAQALAFLIAIFALPSAARALWIAAGDDVRAAIAIAGDPRPETLVDGPAIAFRVVLLAVPVLLAAGAAGAVGHLVQTGGFLATKKLTPKLDRLNVLEGLKNLFSATRLFAVVRAMLGASLVAWLAYRGLTAHLIDLARLSGRLEHVGAVVAEIARGLARDAAIVGLALGALDLLVTRRGWFKRLRMSKDEVKREYKESEGDPHVKAARERAHHEVMAQVTIANVKTASVLVVNPTHLACALRYDEKQGDAAPVVVGTGEGDLAARMIEAAHAYGVPVIRDVPLARALIELQVGDAIPEALYEAVAEILREAWDEAEASPDRENA